MSSSSIQQELEDDDDNVHPLLQRHYSTIGIGDVFLNPPPSTLCLPSSYLKTTTAAAAPVPAKNNLRAWEMVGSIKTVAEDFVVHERAVVVGDDNEEEMIARLDLPSAFLEQADTESSPSKAEMAVSTQSATIVTKNESAKDPLVESIETKDDGSHSKTSGDSSSSTTKKEEEEDSIAVLECVLSKMLHEVTYQESPSTILESLQQLNQKALQVIEKAKNSSSSISSLKEVDIDIIMQSCDTQEILISIFPSTDVPNSASEVERQQKQAKEERGEIHEALRHAFPLLSSEAAATTDNDNHTIRVTVDNSFLELAPYLHDPVADLPQLYDYFKCGYEHAAEKQQAMKTSQNSSSSNKPGRRRGRVNSQSYNRNDIRMSGPILRLRPGLPRSERQPIHRLIESKTKAMLGTSTFPEYPYADTKTTSQDSSSETTAAISVHWTKTAQRKVLSRKRKRDAIQTNTKLPQEYTLCVIRKREVEHLTLINILSSTLCCRPTAIGLAGIKDMHAVTYQFCTLHNVSPKRIRASYNQLKQRGIAIQPLRMVDRALRKGDLDGNHFEIVVRNLRRVLLTSNNGKVEEQFLPVEESHVRAMVGRIQSSGFVNFFGEQRVGDPGLASIVGNRAFDIGRAMLQQDFSKAIDLIMTGRRLISNGTEQEGEEFRLFRQTWRESGGDINLKIKNLPRGNSSLPRERMVLKGLKRYGSDNPLAALKCLQHNDRLFFINAYQSYVWNLAASERLRQWGTKVVVGDLILRDGTHSDEVEVAMPDDLASLTIKDVVLPLPGYTVKYPENEIGKYYRDVLMRENVQFSKESPEEATAKGSYRRLVAVTNNIDFKQTKEGDSINVKFLFDLPKGSYATMLLRELMLTTVVRNVRNS